jgi:hypothetical protein
MPRKQYPYNALTTKEFRKRGWYYRKEEYLNPFHIIKERGDLRILRDMFLKFCVSAGECSDVEQIHEWVTVLQGRVVSAKNNKYFAGEKQDFFGFADYVCIDANRGAVAVQSTSASGHAEHRRKILRNDYAARWVIFHPIELWSWRKSPKVRGQKLLIWKLKVEVITLEDFKEFANANAL